VWATFTIYTYGGNEREPAARQGSERCPDDRYGCHTFSVRCVAVRCVAAAPDGQSWGWHRALSRTRPTCCDPGFARLPSRHPRHGASSRALCGLTGPIPRAPAARGSTEARQRLLLPSAESAPALPRCPCQLPRADARAHTASSTLSVAGPLGAVCSRSFPQAAAVAMATPWQICSSWRAGGRRRAGMSVHPRAGRQMGAADPGSTAGWPLPVPGGAGLDPGCATGASASRYCWLQCTTL